MTEDIDVFVDAVAEQLLALWHHLDHVEEMKM